MPESTSCQSDDFSLQHVTGLVRPRPKVAIGRNSQEHQIEMRLTPICWLNVNKDIYCISVPGCAAFNCTALQQDCLWSRGEWIRCEGSSVGFIWTESGYLCACLVTFRTVVWKLYSYKKRGTPYFLWIQSKNHKLRNKYTTALTRVFYLAAKLMRFVLQSTFIKCINPLFLKALSTCFSLTLTHTHQHVVHVYSL